MSTAEQRAELQNQIWKIANEVRGAVDGWDFKQYVLGTLFYRFISENFSNYIEGGDTEINYAEVSDDIITTEIKEDAIKTKGYFIYPSQLFCNIAKNANANESLNTDLAAIFNSIESSASGYPSEQDKINKIYDPAAGSGSLLLQAKKQFDEHVIEDGFFGQEINHTTYNLARMNMFLHNVNYDKFNIALGNTLLDPKSKADFAFILHTLSYLSPKGRAAIVCFPGIFYRGGAEQKIRKYLVDNEKVAEESYNLSVSTYVEAEDTREIIDIKVLNEEIKNTVVKINILRDEIDKIIEEIEGQ